MKPDLLNFNHEQKKLLKIFSVFEKNVKILDVGCGVGRNLELLKKNGFSNVCGVDINRELVELNLKNGYRCFHPDQIDPGTYDILLMSHLVEHFEWKELQRFITEWLNRLKVGGYLVVATPLPTIAFFNDFDHVKPYLPQGFGMFFGRNLEQIQAQSEKVLELCDIEFYRLPWRLQFFRCFYLKSRNTLPLWFNRFGRIVFFLSRGLLGTKSGWIGLYLVDKDRIKKT